MVKELHSPEQQHANTHRLFIKLCWLMCTHAASADRVVNIDETSCRLLPLHQIRWGRRGVKQAQTQSNTKEATTFTVMDCGPLDMLVQIVYAGRTDAVLPEQPWPERTHVTSESGWATMTTLLQLTATLDDVMNPSKEGQAWILLWTMTSIHASEASLGVMWAAFPRRTVLPPATMHVVLAALRRGRLPQLQELHPGASERHSCPLRHRRLVRRLGHEQSMAAPTYGLMGGSRTHGSLRQKPGVDDWLASLARPQRRRIPRGR